MIRFHAAIIRAACLILRATLDADDHRARRGIERAIRAPSLLDAFFDPPPFAEDRRRRPRGQPRGTHLSLVRAIHPRPSNVHADIARLEQDIAMMLLAEFVSLSSSSVTAAARGGGGQFDAIGIERAIRGMPAMMLPAVLLESNRRNREDKE